MLFNIHHGQMRLRGGRMVFLPKSPKSMLIMQDWDSGMPKAKKEYRADKLGNIDVVHPKHVETMMGLGYPVYGGNGITYPVPLDDLLYPSLHLDSEYWKRINGILKKKMKEN